jgi:flagellar basal-body rod protein FlgF
MQSYAEISLVRGLSWLAESQAAIAHNLANVETTAFKRRAASAGRTAQDFESVLAAKLPTVRYEERTDFRTGSFRETGGRFDIALDDGLFLRVQDPAGRAFYTRNGAMRVDATGQLITADGLRFTDQNGLPIVLGTGEEAPAEVSIAPNGTITDGQSGRSWGPLAIFRLPDASALQPVGNGLFAAPAGLQATPAQTGLRHGYLEGSNVDSLEELVQMIIVERGFAATQRALTGVGRMQQDLIDNVLR